jgi:hypothetical protein
MLTIIELIMTILLHHKGHWWELARMIRPTTRRQFDLGPKDRHVVYDDQLVAARKSGDEQHE